MKRDVPLKIGITIAAIGMFFAISSILISIMFNKPSIIDYGIYAMGFAFLGIAILLGSLMYSIWMDY